MPYDRSAAWVAGALVIGCSSARYGANETGAPSVAFPAHFAEGENRDAGSSPSDAGPPGRTTGADAALEATPAKAARPSPPDPSPLVTREQWEFTFVYDKGAIRVARVKRLTASTAVPTARRIGRFAVELWIGQELVDRVRFDFPLLAADAPPASAGKRPLHDETRFSAGAETSQRVLVPGSDRATSAVLVDRLTGTTTAIAWPPAETPTTSAAPP